MNQTTLFIIGNLTWIEILLLQNQRVFFRKHCLILQFARLLRKPHLFNNY